MKTYKIELVFTDPYIGSRNGGNKIVSEGLTFNKAKKWLLDKHNELFDKYRLSFASALALYRKHRTIDGIYRVGNSYRLDYDSRIYLIVEE